MKKALSLFLVLVLALSMSTVAFAAVKVDPDVRNQNALAGNGWGNAAGSGWWGDVTTRDTIVNLASGDREVQTDSRGTSLSIGIEWGSLAYLDNGTPTDATVLGGPISPQIIKNSNIDVKLRPTKGSQVIDDFYLDTNSANATFGEIVVKFKDPFKSNNDKGVDYAFSVYLSVGGKNWANYTVEISGNYKNQVIDHYVADDTWFDYSYGQILKPKAFIRELEGDLNNGVVIYQKALAKAKYWAQSSKDFTDKDIDNLELYPTIDEVYHIDSLGLTNVVTKVNLNDADPEAYVYDGNFNYLGRGDADLAFADTYYISSEELDIVAEDEPEDEDLFDDEEEDWDYDDNSEGGGDDLYPSNPHDNPGTGK